ncbi:MAG: hypothetical protein K2W78_15160 [Xanthobacteraceae bacterium]|nr:hypothetical protein [Xanthobacteraceae bacterium]
MRIPMPSPHGTNHARLFIYKKPTAAYDALPKEAIPSDLISFLQDKLSPEDLSEFCELAGIDQNEWTATDSDMPKNGIDRPARPAMDHLSRHRSLKSAADADFFRRYPGAKNITVNR